MKRRYKRIAAVLCTGLMLSVSAMPHVYAEEEEEIMLPSGHPMSFFENEMRETDEARKHNTFDFASAAVGVFQGDDVIFTGYYGETDIKNQIPANENSVYEWGSITKTLIWVSAMQLWEQGKLDLDRDVREYLPDGFFQHLSYDDPITMLNLMNHNAGWQETNRPIWKTDEGEILSLREELQAVEPIQVDRPGEVAAYSNYGAAVAGYVVECISGMDFCEYVHKNIFEPLGMEHTALNPAHSDNAWVYEQRKKTRSYKYILSQCIDLGPCLNYVPCYPAGAAAGTLSDLMTYAQALVNDDAPLFQNKETQDMLFTGTDFYGTSDIPVNAHGFWCDEYAVRTYGHNGATTSGQALMSFDPDSKTGLVVMVNEPEGNWFLSYCPPMVFGELSPEKYASGTVDGKTVKGYYSMARSVRRGMLKFVSFLSAFSLGNFGEPEHIGNGVYQITNHGVFTKEAASIYGEKTYSDGSVGIQMSSSDLLKDHLFIVKLCLFTVYVLLALLSVYQLRICYKLKKFGKWTAYAGSSVMTAGRIARIVSVLALFISYIFYANNQSGITFTEGACIGVVQMLCASVCAASAVYAVIMMLSKKEKTKSYRYILHATGSVLVIVTIISFEMYYFW